MSLKRDRASRLSQSISPPPLRRRQRQHALEDAGGGPVSADKVDLRPCTAELFQTCSNGHVLTWNVNGIGRLLGHVATKKQAKISTFFTPTSKDASQHGDSDGADDHHQPSLRKILRRFHYPAFVCLQEVKIATHDESLKRLVGRAANEEEASLATAAELSDPRCTPDREQDEETCGHPSGPPMGQQPQYRSFFALPRDKHNAKGFGGQGKVYGVATLIRSDMMSKYDVTTAPMEWDTEGRVLVTTITSRPADDDAHATHDRPPAPRRIKLINTYFVNGISNAWRDSVTGAVLGSRHDAKRLLHRRLALAAARWEADGWAVVIVGDMNVALEACDGHPGRRMGADHVRNRTHFKTYFLGGGDGEQAGEALHNHRQDDHADRQPGADEVMDGVDVWRVLRPEETRRYTYHGEPAGQWGSRCDRVDLCVASRSMVECGGIRGMEIWDGDPGERAGSDHVPFSVWMDL